MLLKFVLFRKLDRRKIYSQKTLSQVISGNCNLLQLTENGVESMIKKYKTTTSVAVKQRYGRNNTITNSNKKALKGIIDNYLQLSAA